MKNRAIRSIAWNLFHYAVNLFAIFYLKEKSEILNWDVLLVFLPLVALAGSTETFPVLKFRPYCYLDFTAKCFAYVFSQLIYRHIAENVFFPICLVLFFLSAIGSALCTVMIFKRFHDMR